MEKAFLDKWADFLGLNKQKLLATTFLHLITENFLLQITEDTFGSKWLNGYLDEVYTIFKKLGTSPEI